MKMKVDEIKPRASEGDIIELEGKVSHAQKPNEGQYGWSQFIGVKDSTGEQNCWIKLADDVHQVVKGTSIKIKGKLGEEYEDKKSKKMVRSINNCDFEVIGKVQDLAQSSVSSPKNEKVDDKVWKEKDLRMARESALKNIAQYVVAKIIKLEERFKSAQEDVDFIYKDMDGIKSESAIKEERIKKAEDAVGETRFRPASTEQKRYIFGYRNNNDEFCKGIIDSRYMKKLEKREIGDPKKLSLEDATEWLLWWWGPDKKSGERKKRELEHPRNENGTLVGDLVKGEKTSLVKDELVDDINAWRRENFLVDDKKFKEELGYNPKLEELSEEDLLKIKGLIKHYHPKNWNGDK